MQTATKDSTQTIERMAEAAGLLLSSLSDDLRERVRYPFADEDQRRL